MFVLFVNFWSLGAGGNGIISSMTVICDVQCSILGSKPRCFVGNFKFHARLS